MKKILLLAPVVLAACAANEYKTSDDNGLVNKDNYEFMSDIGSRKEYCSFAPKEDGVYLLWARDEDGKCTQEIIKEVKNEG